jgi:hypothetical protein
MGGHRTLPMGIQSSNNNKKNQHCLSLGLLELKDFKMQE